ncbi:LPS assembly lipoprotein LptE [Polymorphum gilvum]|uniref:LPS-assembly lipoprotein n=1 Tax=Polymorphum gilvum (strain LMG 25793 / CGMCC 1.9160 / SL003B-26A1) TaxID=991905 RepID=F2IYK8_POLGS|nr:LPS assembly lipoprotein LptE [Polymorphum gilvum]ADZ68521.1 hypothetical protein SL003B_0082 [Polymorphum gilvum SL003B-26A1]
MSSPDTLRPARRAVLVLTLVLVGGLALAGCQVRPLYGSLGAPDMVPVQDELAAIEIEPIDTATSAGDARRALLNELIFGFERGAPRADRKYRLKIVMDVRVAEVALEELADVPAAYTTTMNASFVLSDMADDRTLMTGKSFATASYDFSSQRFSNLRARRDAEQRVAKAVAQDIQARIAGYFAGRK